MRFEFKGYFMSVENPTYHAFDPMSLSSLLDKKKRKKYMFH